MKKKILVIDDEEILTRTMAKLLEKLQYEVEVTTRPEEAITLAQNGEFDLILCDIRMPGKNGVETIREMRKTLQRSGRNHPPVIFLTGFADAKLEEAAQTLQPIAYVYKPFDTGKLVELIASALQ